MSVATLATACAGPGGMNTSPPPDPTMTGMGEGKATDSTSMPALRPLRLPTYKVEATAANEGSSEYGKTNGPTTMALFKCTGP